MAKYGMNSLNNLATAHSRLQLLFSHVIRGVDNKILWGHRGETEQNKAFEEKKSKVRWPDGPHNSFPSKAVDAVPYPIKWGETGTREQRERDIRRFYHFAGFVRGVAFMLKIKIKWGGDWDGDFDFDDQTFNDLPHYELDE